MTEEDYGLYNLVIKYVVPGLYITMSNENLLCRSFDSILTFTNFKISLYFIF